MATTTTNKKKTAVKKKTSAATKTTKTKKTASSRAKTATAKAAKPKTSVKRAPRTAMQKLNLWNWAFALLLAAQGIAIIVLGKNAGYPVNTGFLTAETITPDGTTPALVPATRHLFDLNMLYVVAAFLLISALSHLVIATLYRKRYEAELNNGMNRARWYDNGVVVGLMIAATAMLSGVSDISTLLLIFGSVVVMSLLGLSMEVYNPNREKTSWLSYKIAMIAGLLPWLVIGIYLWGANKYGEGNIASYVYYIVGSMFVLFGLQVLLTKLHFKKKGRWASYLETERAYLVISLIAQSALAWQIFFGTLKP